MDFLAVLGDFGLSGNESRVFLALCELGPSKASEIAQKCGVQRPAVYFVLDKLVEKSLVSTVSEKNEKIFSAVAPQKLLEMQKNKAKQTEERLGVLVKQLTGGYQKIRRPKVSVFYGLDGIKSVFELSLENTPADGELLLFPGFHGRRLLGSYIEQWHARRRAKKLALRVIYDSASESLERARELSRDDSVKNRYFTIAALNPVQYFIFGRTVAILSLEKEERLAIIIEDEKIAKSFRQNFEVLWKKAG